MTNPRLERARREIVDSVEEAAQNEGLDVATASNAAYDLATQDYALTRLCTASVTLSHLDDELRRERGEIGAVRSPLLNAGIDVDDAIQARVSELIDEAIAQTEALAIEEATA